MFTLTNKFSPFVLGLSSFVGILFIHQAIGVRVALRADGEVKENAEKADAPAQQTVKPTANFCDVNTPLSDVNIPKQAEFKEYYQAYVESESADAGDEVKKVLFLSLESWATSTKLKLCLSTDKEFLAFVEWAQRTDELDQYIASRLEKPLSHFLLVWRYNQSKALNAQIQKAVPEARHLKSNLEEWDKFAKRVVEKAKGDGDLEDVGADLDQAGGEILQVIMHKFRGAETLISAFEKFEKNVASLKIKENQIQIDSLRKGILAVEDETDPLSRSLKARQAHLELEKAVKALEEIELLQSHKANLELLLNASVGLRIDQEVNLETLFRNSPKSETTLPLMLIADTLKNSKEAPLTLGSLNRKGVTHFKNAGSTCYFDALIACLLHLPGAKTEFVQPLLDLSVEQLNPVKDCGASDSSNTNSSRAVEEYLVPTLPAWQKYLRRLNLASDSVVYKIATIELFSALGSLPRGNIPAFFRSVVPQQDASEAMNHLSSLFDTVLPMFQDMSSLKQERVLEFPGGFQRDGQLVKPYLEERLPETADLQFTLDTAAKEPLKLSEEFGKKFGSRVSDAPSLTCDTYNHRYVFEDDVNFKGKLVEEKNSDKRVKVTTTLRAGPQGQHLPKTLKVSWARSPIDPTITEKNRTPVEIEESIYLAPFCGGLADNNARNQKTRYSLRSLTMHIGGKSAKSGHFVAILKKDSIWYYVDNSIFEEVQNVVPLGKKGDSLQDSLKNAEKTLGKNDGRFEDLVKKVSTGATQMFYYKHPMAPAAKK